MLSKKHGGALLIIAVLSSVIVMAWQTRLHVAPLEPKLSDLPHAFTTKSIEQKKLAPIPVTAQKVDARIAKALQKTSLRQSAIDRPHFGFAQGQWQINGTILWYFDYFLSLEGERSIQEISQLLKLDVDAHYEPGLAQKLYGLFLRYVAYLQAVAQRENAVSEEQIIAEHLSAKDMQQEVRMQYFSEEEINNIFDDWDKVLTAEASLRESQRTFDAFQQQSIQQGSNVSALATEMFGPVAAQNLAVVRYRRQEWQGRIAHFRLEKSAIIRAYAADNEGAEHAVSALESRLFNEQEIKRVRVLTKKS